MARGNNSEQVIGVQAGVLAKAMKHASATVERRNTIPILANVRVLADGDAVEVTSTDLDVEFRQRLPLTQAGQLAVTVDAQRLYAVAHSVDANVPITLGLDGTRLEVKAGRSRWLLPVLPVDDFPAMRFMPGEWTEWPAGTLQQAIARTAPSVCTEMSKPSLQGTFLNAEAEKVRLVSTDGHRAFVLDTQVPWPDGAPEVIVPAKPLRIIAALVDGGAARLTWSERLLRCEAGEATVTAKVLDQTFPDYRRFLPPLGETAVRVGPDSLKAALRRTGLVASERTKAVKVEREEGLVRVSVTSPEGGVASEELPADGPAAAACGFNATLLEQLLDALGGETVEIHQQDPGSAALLVRVPRDNALAVLMPMRV